MWGSTAWGLTVGGHTVAVLPISDPIFHIPNVGDYIVGTYNVGPYGVGAYSGWATDFGSEL